MRLHVEDMRGMITTVMKHLSLISYILSIVWLIPVSALPEADTFYLTNPFILPSKNVLSASAFDIIAGIADSNSTIRFALEANHDLISQDVNIPNVNVNGQSTIGRPSSSELHLTKGSVSIQQGAGKGWDNAGWARLAVSKVEDGVYFDGTFTLFSSQYEIQLESADDGFPKMSAHKHKSDFAPGNNTSHSRCATDIDFSPKRQWNAWGDNLEGNIGNTYGCPNTRQIANIGIMADCTYTAGFNSSESARRYILNMVNTASVVFENSFNISLSIQNLTLSDEECPSTTSQSAWNAACSVGDMNTRLQSFSSWRSSNSDNNAYWTLLTGCSTNNGEVGVSWIGALCNSGSGSSNGGASANVVARTQSEWQVFAHESAHTFGAVHDCNSGSCGSGSGSGSSQCCPLSSDTCDAGGQYIMNPVSGPGMTRFSPCTIGNVCSQMGTGQVESRCLVDSQGGNSTGTNGECGNGVVEAGEACDCGNGACDEQETRCCDSVTCQWMGGDECDGSDNGGGNDQGRGNTGSNGSSGRDSFSSWIDDHLKLVIGLTAGIGGALLLLVLGCIICSCRRPKSPKIPNQR